MFPTLRRIPALLLLLCSLSTVVHSRQLSLFTSSVSYCDPPESILVERFDVAYFANTNSVSFNVSAASVLRNLSVSANLLLTVYGKHPVNLTLNLCSMFDGALCPLPIYNFTGATTIKLPQRLGVRQKIPTIAFEVPDLEAFAQLTLKDINTGELKACIQATLSNGWSAYNVGAESAVRALALFALLAALWRSVVHPRSTAPHRFVETISLFQYIACTGLLAINYPSFYLAFTTNFAWALGLVKVVPVQRWIVNARRATGGNVDDEAFTAPAALGVVNRKLSPYNVMAPSRPSMPQIASALHPSTLQLVFSLLDSDGPTNTNAMATSAAAPPVLAKRSSVVVTSAFQNLLQAGIPIYVNSIGISTGNSFMTVFFAVIGVVGVAALVLASIIVALLLTPRWYPAYALRIRNYSQFTLAWCIRVALIIYTPILVFAFFQWTLKDSRFSLAFSILLTLLIIATLMYSSISILRRARRPSPDSLHDGPPGEKPDALRPLFAAYRVSRYYYFIVVLLATVLRAIIISFVRYSGEAQVALMLLLELGLLVAQVVLHPVASTLSSTTTPFPLPLQRDGETGSSSDIGSSGDDSNTQSVALNHFNDGVPHKPSGRCAGRRWQWWWSDAGRNALATYAAATRVTACALLVAFAEAARVNAIPRLAIGMVLATVLTIGVLLLVVVDGAFALMRALPGGRPCVGSEAAHPHPSLLRLWVVRTASAVSTLSVFSSLTLWRRRKTLADGLVMVGEAHEVEDDASTSTGKNEKVVLAESGLVGAGLGLSDETQASTSSVVVADELAPTGKFVLAESGLVGAGLGLSDEAHAPPSSAVIVDDESAPTTNNEKVVLADNGLAKAGSGLSDETQASTSSVAVDDISPSTENEKLGLANPVVEIVAAAGMEALEALEANTRILALGLIVEDAENHTLIEHGNADTGENTAHTTPADETEPKEKPSDPSDPPLTTTMNESGPVPSVDGSPIEPSSSDLPVSTTTTTQAMPMNGTPSELLLLESLPIMTDEIVPVMSADGSLVGPSLDPPISTTQETPVQETSQDRLLESLSTTTVDETQPPVEDRA